MKSILVIAGTYQQYRNWLDANMPNLLQAGYKSNEVVYVSRPDKLYGRTADRTELVWYGTFWEREDCDRLEEMAMTMGLPVPHLKKK